MTEHDSRSANSGIMPSPFFKTCVSVWMITSTDATSVRLLGGSSPNEGTVSIYHNGWGTICDDNFGTPDGDVICRMLGYDGLDVLKKFSAGSGSILLDEVGCSGTESDIASCSNTGWGRHDCSHSEDVGVVCRTSSARLIGGRGNYEGRVEVYYNSRWNTVCDRDFDDVDAEVVCRMLGFSTSGAKAHRGGQFGMAGSVTPIILDGLRCNGSESDVFRCARAHTSVTTTTSCHHTNDAGVSCSHTHMRLVGGSLPSEGRLEIQHNGVWGSVCSHGFDQDDATVVCRMFGVSNASLAVVRTDGRYGKGEGPVWLSDVSCHGDESDIGLCNITGWDNNTCNHGNDVGIVCEPTEVRLVGGVGPWEGRVEVKIGSTWGAVCDTNFGQEEATVICRMLGYHGRDVKHTVLPRSYFGYTSTSHFDQLMCDGDEDDILQCKANYHTASCYSAEAGLRCQGSRVRLVGGATSSEGRVEVFHAGHWGSICDAGWDDTDATVVCRMLVSYPQDRVVRGKAFSGSFFGYGDGPVWLSDVRCNGTESDVMSCPADGTGGVNCDHSRDAGAACYFPREARLIRGSVSSEGTVEILDSGLWRSICDDHWDNREAEVICTMLGYWSSAAVAYNSSHFGSGNGTATNISARCNGREASLSMCATGQAWGSDTCSHSQDAGVRCTPTAISGDMVRLVDGPGPGQGRLEVNYKGQWVSFCQDQWDPSANSVVCRTLRYPNSNASSYTIKRGLSSTGARALSCLGNETNIGWCQGDFNVSRCDKNTGTVGIVCSGGITGALSDGSTLAGLVYVKFPNSSTSMTVCSQGVNHGAAQVFCNMAGYSDTNPVVLSGISSNLPVAFSSVSCDGWEEHVSQCVTQRANATQCSTSANIKCFNCTTVLTGTSGTVVSPNFPGSYPSDTDCLYVIRPGGPSTGLYKVVFNSLQLPGDGDYVEVRDDHMGQHLGHFTTSAQVPLLVAHDEFYIRFKTNGNRSASGFNITWSPLQLEDVLMVGCDPDGWHLSVNTTILRRMFPDSGVSQIKLSDQYCTGSVLGDLVVFTQGYSECSTRSTTSGDRVAYTNELVYPEANSPFPLITHGYRWKVKVECDVRRTDTIATHFHPNQTVVHQATQVPGSSHYSLDLKFYTDSSYYKEVTGNPVMLKTGDDVYVAARLNSGDTHIKMRLDTCTTKPDPSSGQDMTYTLIKDGCVIDHDTSIISQGSHETRFAFNAFEFPSNRDSVYVNCNATFCKTSDMSKHCLQTCGSPQLVGREISDRSQAAVGTFVAEREIHRKY